MKRILAHLFILLALASGIAACAAAPQGGAAAPQVPGEVQPAKEIVLFNWTDYMNPDLLAQFEQETGIRVVEDYFSSNEELIAKLKGGASGYALIVPSEYAVPILIQSGLISPLNHANLPNLSNLSARFQDNELDPGNAHCIPYQWGISGILYLSDQIETPTSWQTIFAAQPGDPQYGRMTMLDDPRESFAAALFALGYDPNTTNESELQQAKALLIQARRGLSGYDSDTFEDLVASGENLVSHGWNGEALIAQQEQNEALQFAIPQEGSIIWMDELCIPSTASPEQKLAAEMFINFILRPDVGAALSEYIGYATPNAAAEATLPEEIRTNPMIYPPESERARLQFLKPLGEFDAVYIRLWDEVKTAP
ncbi:MAG: ABC transporter substrate-binding protein [Anaerolineales bacterium]